MAMHAPNYIRLWRWEDAPQELRDLSPHGGGEYWLALVPPKLVGEWTPWIDNLGVCRVTTHLHPELQEYQVIIGAHA